MKGGIKPDLLKYGGKKQNYFLTKLFQRIEWGEKVFLDWNVSIISSVYKKGNKGYTKNYSCISVIPSTVRVFSKIVKEKIQQMKNLNEVQNGFRAEGFCLANILSIRHG